VGRTFGHAAPATTRAHRTPFAREGDQAIEAARRAPKPREAGCQSTTAEKVAELLFDEPRQAFAVAQVGGGRAEGLEVIADDLVQHALRRRPRLVGR
jgi:hypothetical protein